jgi:hypothetical protein
MNSTDLWDILGIFRIHTRLFYSRSLSSAMPALEQGDPDIMVRVEVVEETTKFCSMKEDEDKEEDKDNNDTKTRRTRRTRTRV